MEHLTREQIAEQLNVTPARLRPYCDAPGADAHFKAEKVRGRRVYPELSVALFSHALRVTPKRFLATIEPGEVHQDISVTDAPNPPAETKVTDSVITVIDSLTGNNKEALNVMSHIIGEAVSDAIINTIGHADDELLNAEKVRVKLAGPIPKTLKPIAFNPARWSRHQVNAYIAKIRGNA